MLTTIIVGIFSLLVGLALGGVVGLILGGSMGHTPTPPTPPTPPERWTVLKTAPVTSRNVFGVEKDGYVTVEQNQTGQLRAWHDSDNLRTPVNAVYWARQMRIPVPPTHIQEEIP